MMLLAKYLVYDEMRENQVYDCHIVYFCYDSRLYSSIPSIAQVIYNSPNEYVTDLTSNPPKSSSGTPTPIQPHILNTICANLAGMSGSLADVTRSFTDCMSI